MWKKINLLISVVWMLSAQAQPVMPITVGAIYNLTGSQSLLDTYSADGAKLAASEINQAGGLLGRPVQLKILNGQTEPEVIARDAAELGADKDIVAVIGLSDTDMAQAAIPTLAKYHKLLIISGATSPVLVKLSPNWVFMATFSDDQQAEKAADFAFKTQHYKTGVLLFQKDSQYANLLARYFQKFYEKLGGEFIATSKFTREHSNISAFLAQIEKKGVVPDFLYLAADPTTSVNIVQQLRQKGFEQPIVGGDGLDTIALRQQSRASHWVGSIFYTTHAFVESQNPNLRVQNFIEDYRRMYHQIPDSSFAALGYDTMNLLAEAIRQANSTDPNKIRASLKNLANFEGLTGFMSFSNSFIPKKTISLVELRNGEEELLAPSP